MNRERTTVIIADIEKYLRELEDLNIKTIEDLKERKNFYSASMLLLTIFNRVIDLGEELVLRKKLGMPATYSEIFALLRKADIINDKLFLELREIVRLRNRLSHEYFTFTEKDVFEGLKKIKIVKQFIKLLTAQNEKKSSSKKY
jgi:uncharacterized protein YutE (UPF0331/DUF86 family)